jgi:RimJ/RimL family protein N-acetyltransferase
MLQGDKLVLRAWRESDLATLAELRNDIDLQALLMTQARPNSIERVRHWLVERSSREDMVFFVVVSRRDDAVLGYVQVAGIDLVHGVGELGICLSPSAQGGNLAQEACQLLERYLVQTLSLRKLTLKVLADNARAITFYLKSGYREVGRMERQFLIDGQYEDVVIMERFLDA